MSDERLAQLEAALRLMLLNLKNQDTAIAALSANDEKLAAALSSLHRRMMLQEAGSAIVDMAHERSLN